MSDAIRTLKIKSGAVRRLAKDVTYSQKEAEAERQRLAKIMENGGDEYEVRAQDKVIADAEQMIPDYRRRLASAVEELEGLVASGDPALTDTEELSQAKDLLVTAKSEL